MADTAGSAGGITNGGVAQAASVPTIQATQQAPRSRPMTLLLLEALGAGLIFVGIIWWTMFSGRKNGERPSVPESVPETKLPPSKNQ
jgi:hypothetical protein